MKKIICILLCMTFLMTGCQSVVEEKSEDLSIVTSFYPVMLIAKAVTENAEGVTVTNMTEPQTGCLHDYALLPEDIKTLEKCDIFVINGLGMESFVEKAINNIPALNAIDLSGNVKAVDNNAHIWLSPFNASVMAQNLCNALTLIDEKNAELYKSNTESFCNRLEELDKELKDGLSGIENRDVVTFHEAFTYFAYEFDLNVVSVIEREPGEEPTTAEIKETVDLINSKNVKALFAEPQYSATAAEVIASETGLEVYTLDPVVTGENHESYEMYFVRMRENLKTLQKALGD